MGFSIPKDFSSERELQGESAVAVATNFQPLPDSLDENIPINTFDSLGSANFLPGAKQLTGLS